MAPSGRGTKAKPASSGAGSQGGSQEKKQLRTRSAQAGLQVYKLALMCTRTWIDFGRLFSSLSVVSIVI